MHYGPAIERVLGIIQKGLKDRLTVNGEILRLHKDLAQRMRDLTDAMEDLERLLEPVSSKHNSRLRESISSIVSGDRSFSSTTMAGTPGSSPASSIDLSSQTSRPTPKYGMNGYSKPRAASQPRPPLTSQNKRGALLNQNRRPTTPLSLHSSGLQRRGVSPAPGPPSVYKQGAYIPPTNVTARPSPSPLPSKPRWSSTVRPDEFSHAPRAASAMSPTPFRKYFTPRSISSSTALPLRSPLGRESPSSPSTISTLPAETPDQQYLSFAQRVASPTNGRTGSILDPVPYHRSRNVTSPQPGLIRSPSSMAMQSNQQYAMQSTHKPTPTISSIPTPNRPPSSLSRGVHVSLPPRVSSLGARLEQQTPITTVKHEYQNHGQTLSIGSSGEPSLPDLDARSDVRSDFRSDGGLEDDETKDQLTSEPSSSPLSRKTITRPGSQMATGRGGKRMSMLPVPVGGRSSSLGHRNA